MARMIDADVAIKRFRGWLEGPHEATEYNAGFDDAIYRVLDVIDHMPTLTQPNDPLTLEELREMDGAPVWVKCLKSNKYINSPTGWRILEKSLAGTFGVWDGEGSLIERNYGTDWLAYRRPPEGEEAT